METTVIKSHPTLVFCRSDFLKAVSFAWEGDSNDMFCSGLNFEKIREVCSLDDLVENIVINKVASDLKALEGIPISQFPLLTNTTEGSTFFTQALESTSRVASITDYLYGRNEHVYALDSEDNSFKLLAKGDCLFVGIEPGFVDQMDDKIKYQNFLTNCLEVCRKSMRSPTLTSSPLYRQFIFSNVNV